MGEKRRRIQRVVTEDAFKELFNESVLPDLERYIKGMTEELIRVNVQARYLKQHDSNGGGLS